MSASGYNVYGWLFFIMAVVGTWLDIPDIKIAMMLVLAWVSFAVAAILKALVK